MAKQEPPPPTDGRVDFYKETGADRLARWAFWIVFGLITIGSLVWVRFSGQ